ncbi:MAG: hypothetical protein SCH66_09835 [Methanolobus sp.]|nr:hypothetical protein [Methanolobus sp.]
MAIIKTKKLNGKEQVIATNGDEGFYIYELNGDLCSKTVQKCTFKEDSTVVLKKLESIAKLRLNIQVDDR